MMGPISIIAEEGSHALALQYRKVSGLTAEQAVDLKRICEEFYKDGRRQGLDEVRHAIQSIQQEG